MAQYAEKQEWAEGQIAEFARRRPAYVEYSDVLYDFLSRATGRIARYAIVESRAKSVPSFAEKIFRKGLPDPVNEFTDLCGGRIITHTPAEVQAVSAFVEGAFDIMWEESYDVAKRLSPSEFGYRSVHYIVRFRPDGELAERWGVEIPKRLLARTDGGEMDNPWAEIQVRTLLEHAWASANHGWSYKAAFEVPETWLREMAAVAALLETADRGFERIAAGLQQYASSYGAYLDDDEVKDELWLQRFVLGQDPSDASVAVKIAKMSISLGQFDEAAEVLAPFVPKSVTRAALQVADCSPPPEDPHETDGDFACWQEAFEAPGRLVADTEGVSVDILRERGVALTRVHAEKPRSSGFREGVGLLVMAGTEPYRDVDAMASLGGALRRAHATRRAGDAYRRAFEIDPFDPYALGNHIKCQIADEEDISFVASMAPSIRASMQRCREQAAVGVNLPWAYSSLSTFHLLLGEPHEALAAKAKAVQLSTAAFMIETSLAGLLPLSPVSNLIEGYEWLRRLMILALFAHFPEHDLGDLKPSDATISGPVVILAGGCAPGQEMEIAVLTQSLPAALGGFLGTLISGGTQQGVARIAGDVGQANPQVNTVGYAPRHVPVEAIVDRDTSRYREIVTTDGTGFSPLEPLQYWTDILAAGIAPEDVTLVGFGGGKVSAAEYKIALALGASVTIVDGGGRAASRLLADEDWRDAPRLRVVADAAELKDLGAAASDDS